MTRDTVNGWLVVLLIALCGIVAMLTGCSGRPKLEPGFRWYTHDQRDVTNEVIGGGDVRMRR